MQERRPVEGGVMRDADRAVAARSPARVVRYGNALNGTVEHNIRPGFTSRTFVSGGRVLYTRVYQNHVWHRFGQTFGYETFVPAVRCPVAYYSWALAAWPRPVTYAWGWRVQPWYPMYGVLFMPYPVYATPDQWMTDYVLAQSMQGAYAAQNASPPRNRRRRRLLRRSLRTRALQRPLPNRATPRSPRNRVMHRPCQRRRRRPSPRKSRRSSTLRSRFSCRSSKRQLRRRRL
jgi:hypothetical protein